MNSFYIKILSNNGYEHIGLINSEKSIWGYAKDGMFVFCDEESNIVNRNSLNITDDVVVLSEKDNIIKVVGELENCNNCIIINKDNRIIYSSSEDCQLKRINTDSVILLNSNSLSDFLITLSQPAYTRYPSHIGGFIGGSIITILGGDICKFMYPYFIYENCHIFSDESGNDGSPNKYVIYIDGFKYVIDDQPMFWVHKNNSIHIIWRDDSREKINVLKTNSKEPLVITPSLLGDVGGSCNCMYDKIFSDSFLLIPEMNGNWAIGVHYDSICERISYNIMDIHICYNDSVSFSNNIIKIRGDETILYDIYKGRIHIKYETDKYIVYEDSINCNNKRIGVYSIPDKTIIPIPSIYEDINIINEELGILELVKSIVNNGDSLKSIYLHEKGYIIPEDSWRIPEIYINWKECDHPFLVFSFKGKMGLLYKDDIALFPRFDYIKGFDYDDSDYLKQDKHYDRSDKYIPKCVVIGLDDQEGLFIAPDCIYEPIYDSINCKLIFEDKAYFITERNGKFGLLCDDVSFLNIIDNPYDNIELIKSDYHHPFFVLEQYKDDVTIYSVIDIGTCYSRIDSRLAYTILGDYSEFLFIDSRHYIADDVFFLYTGEPLFELNNEYEYIETSSFYVFRKFESDQFVFLTGRGEEIKGIEKPQSNIIKLKYKNSTYEFNKYDMDIRFVDENDGYGDNDDIYNYDWEKETYYALGGDDYDSFKENGGDLDRMMDSMGY